MTDMTRSTTLSPRRSAAALTSRPKPSTTTAPAAKPTAERTTGQGETAERVVRSDALLQGHSYISIVHNGETYRLRATRLGKLILTK
ncbi:hemin uptake protein HemP [Paraburkholderia sp. EG304]|uniref:hemin uptake protein HemP n=1 Tax=Paraburkholderia sp. EG304 TaxID=3237015 RepID=UPI00397A0D5D